MKKLLFAAFILFFIPGFVLAVTVPLEKPVENLQHLIQSDDTLVVGGSSTSTDGIFEVNGNSALEGTVEVDSDWVLDSQSVGGEQTLAIVGQGADDAAKAVIHPKGAANESKLTLTQSSDLNNFSSLIIEKSGGNSIINSSSTGSGTVEPLHFQIDSTNAMTIDTSRNVSVGDVDGAAVFNVQNSSGQNLIEADTVNEEFIIRQPGSTAGQDEVQMSYDTNGNRVVFNQPVNNDIGNGYEFRIDGNTSLKVKRDSRSWTDSSVSSFFQVKEDNKMLFVGDGGNAMDRTGVSTNGMTISQNQFGGLELPDGLLNLHLDAAGKVGFTINGASSQSANLTEWQDSAGNVLAKVGPNGTTTAPGFHATASGITFPDGTTQTTAASGGGGSPAGSDGAVQFNSSGSFGADDSNFFWDDTANELGIATSTPEQTLHVDGVMTSSVQQFSIAGSGDAGQADATTTPAQNTVRATCDDAEGCVLHFSDTGVTTGQKVTVINDGSVGIDLNENDDNLELSSSPYGLTQWDSITLVRLSDRWVEISRSDN